MTRWMLTCFAMLSMLAIIAAAAPAGNSAVAAACENGGYLSVTRADKAPFTNEGQCTRYAAQGNALVPVPVESFLRVSYEEVIGSQPGGYIRTVTGAGLKPGADVTISGFGLNGWYGPLSFGTVSSAGEFSHVGEDSCYQISVLTLASVDPDNKPVQSSEQPPC